MSEQAERREDAKHVVEAALREMERRAQTPYEKRYVAEIRFNVRAVLEREREVKPNA